jgi:hypothetical protein
MDTLGEFLPRELRVEDLPRISWALVGDDCPEFRELGLKRAVAGEEDFPNKAPKLGCKAGAAGGVVTPRPMELGLDLVGVR